MHVNTKHNHAFSLVELSIVLVILGLLVGGVMSGQSLIRAAELRAVTTEFNQYQAAVNVFRDKYFSIPGDMANATAFWGEADTDSATCKVTLSTGTETCNGDGNGWIDSSTASDERLRFWQHLANAGMISGSFTGVKGATRDFILDVNIPSSKIDNAGYYTWSSSDATNLFLLQRSNITKLGRINSDGSNSNEPFLTPEEAWNLDVKIDDGLPGTGQFRPYNVNILPNCTTGTTASTASYQLSNSAVSCNAIYLYRF